jgi:hypothetical protein
MERNPESVRNRFANPTAPLTYVENEVPQPQERVALGLM